MHTIIVPEIQKFDRRTAVLLMTFECTKGNLRVLDSEFVRYEVKDAVPSFLINQQNIRFIQS